MNLLVFPNQLFLDHPGLNLRPSRVVLIEDSLFFGDANYPMKFHRQKLWLHRATMKRYETHLRDKGVEILYLEYDPAPEALKTSTERSCRFHDTSLAKADYSRTN